MEKREENSFESNTYIFWEKQISAANQWREEFNNTGDKIVSRFRDEDRYDHDRRYNILYSNTETLLPVVYNSAPRAEVIAQDPRLVANRKGAEVIEKAVNYYIENTDFDDKARLATMDFLLSGMGQIRPCYKSLIDEIELEDGTFQENVVFEEISYDYVYWKDFIYPEAATWEDVNWVAFRARMTYDQAVEKFGEEKAKLLSYEPYSVEERLKGKDRDVESDRAEVYEIWDKKFRQQVFYAESASGALLEINEDPLELADFFPVPKPLLSITTSNTLLPVPLYKMYEDQAIELNKINERIYAMIDNMKRRGFYDASIDELGSIENMGDNTFYPVKDWGNFSSKGGMNGVMQTEDITSYANILQILEQSRRQLLEDIFQIIGISDIRRAQTDPRETLGAQKLKSRYGTIRISTYQRKVAEFMRDLLRITGEIIVNQFDADTLAVITNTPLETKTRQDEQGQTIVEHVGVIDLLDNLRSKAPVDITINVETDSTIIEDQEEDRAAMVEAIGSLGEFTNLAPALIESIGMDATAKVLMGIIQRFKLGRDIQQEVQDHLDEIERNGLPDTPSPEEVLAQAELEKTKMQLQFETMKMQTNAAIEAGKLQIKQQEHMLKAQELGIEKEFNDEKINLEALDKIIKMKGLEIEAINPNKNVVADGE